MEEIKEGELVTECGQTVSLAATFPGAIKKGEKQHWNRAGKGVQAKFRVEGKEGFYKLRKAGDYVMLIPLQVGRG